MRGSGKGPGTRDEGTREMTTYIQKLKASATSRAFARLAGEGWKADRFKNVKSPKQPEGVDMVEYRLDFNPNVVRFERKAEGRDWVRLCSVSYAALDVTLTRILARVASAKWDGTGDAGC